MASRKAALTAFYDGPVLAAHGAAASATMVDFDDVHLLVPVVERFTRTPRPAVGEGRAGPSRVLMAVYSMDPESGGGRWELGVPPTTWRTAPYQNDHPALPVRDDKVVVMSAAFPDASAAAAARARLGGESGAVQVLGLEPTARSAYR